MDSQKSPKKFLKLFFLLAIIVVLFLGVGVYFASFDIASKSLSSLLPSTSTAGNSGRLSIQGSQILLPNGQPIILRGWNWGSWGTPEQQDAAANISQGANYVRVPLSWYFGDGTGATNCGTGQDSYDPGQPGNINPSNLKQLDQEIQWASSAHLWVDLMVRGGDCDFWTNPKIIPQYIQMWQFLANRYKNTPYIGSYEILSEPHPALLANGAANNTLVKSLDEQTIAAIRAIDPSTPIVVGAAQTYDIRNMADIYMPNVPNLIYTFDFFELKSYVKSSKLTKFSSGANGYPGTYQDTGNSTDTCNYPGRGQKVYMDRSWLTGLVNCATSFSTQDNVPIYANQIGLYTATPDGMQYVEDVLSLFNQDNINWTYWQYRALGAGESDSQAVLYQTSSGTWTTKTSWLNIISSYFKGNTSTSQNQPST